MKTLITNIEQFSTYISNITANLEFSSFKSEIEAATIEYMLPYIGKKTHDKLCSISEISDIEQELKDKLCRALANYSALKYTPISDTFFSAQGLKTVKSENQTSAFEYQKRDRMNKYAADADIFMDDALLFLDAHRDVFTDWATEIYPKRRRTFLQSTEEFSEIVNIGNSRRTFLKLKPTITKIEKLVILPLLGTERYEEILSHLVEDDLYEKDKEVLYLIQAIVAHKTIVNALTYESTFKSTSEGLLVVSFFDSKNEKDSLAKIIRQASADAESLAIELSKIIALQNQKEAPKTFEYPNKKENKHFVL